MIRSVALRFLLFRYAAAVQVYRSHIVVSIYLPPLRRMCDDRVSVNIYLFQRI
jgi:hypothetical protein